MLCAPVRSDADPSKDSFIRLVTKGKIIMVCYVIFTLSAGLGFLDATLSLFAIETVIALSPVEVSLLEKERASWK